MGSKCVWVLMMFVFIQMCLIDPVQGCWEKEKLALFQLKPFFDDPNGYLSDWMFERDNNSDCCLWKKVTCSNTTGRVIGLYLSDTRSSYLGEWKLNASLFSAFQQLQEFFLLRNYIVGFVEKRGLDKLSRLNNLEYLHLGGNNFNNDILSSLHVLSSLKGLYLYDNKLNGRIDLQGFDNLQALDLSNNEIEKVEFSKGALSSLNSLGLSNNKLNGTIDLQGLDNLKFLNLGGNKLNNSIFSSIRAPSSLIDLNLYDIGLKGIVDIGELHSLSNLESLNMGGNDIDKFIVPKDNTSLKGLIKLRLENTSIHDGSSLLQSLGSFPSLRILYLTYNNFSEPITAQESLHNSTSLEWLYLDHSSVHISLFHSIAAFTSLQTLLMTYSQLNGTLSDFQDLPNTFKNLRNLYMDGTNISRTFFQNIGLMTSLEILSLSDCGIQDTLSIQDGGALVELLYHQHGLQEVDLSDNNLIGEFPNWLLDNNMELYSLDLSNNLLGGNFQLPIHSHTNLIALDISNNSFHGPIPVEIGGHLPSLTSLDLSKNHFDGSIPSSIGDMKLLERLDLSFNRLSDSLTKASSWLRNMSRLVKLKMSNNHLEGQIPLELCELKYLTVLNLAENNISGSLPSCFSSLRIQQVQLSKNRLCGQLKDVLFNSSFLLILDLSYNQLHGSIPTWIGGNSNLVYLILSHNNLVGNVPTQICQLNQLRLLDLSHNAFSGNIPPCLDVTSLHDNGKSILFYGYDNGMVTYMIGSQVNIIPEALEFTTKTISYSYQGIVLSLMSGIDLSCNKLTGSIPQRVGNLTRIHALNLSHNDLIGPIPPTFLKLKQMESLDLSYNRLSGTIPPQLADLSMLSFLNVANNNLSGKIPESTQFIGFEEKRFEGNPLLCGLPLHKSCDPKRPSPRPKASTDNGEVSDYFDMDIFYMSFTGSYIIVLLGIVAILYLNPSWRRAWFYLAETSMASCYYFVLDNLSRRFCHLQYGAR